MYSPEVPNPESYPLAVALLDFREDVHDDMGKPDGEVIASMLTQWENLNEAILKSLFSEPEEAKSNLSLFKRKIEKVEGHQSRPSLSASAIQAMTDSYVFMPATEQRHRNNMTEFATLFDTGYGINLVATGVIVAEKTIQGRANDTLLELLDNSIESLSPLEQVEIDLRFNQLANLLKKDPSGFLLVDSIVNLVKDPQTPRPEPIPPFLVKEFVIAGAEFGAKLYKKLYPLTDQTTPPKSF